MKVLHIMSGFGGGISSFIKNKATALKNSDVVFDVLTYDTVNESFEKAINEMGGVIYYMDNPKQYGYKKFYKMVNKAFECQPDDLIIHCHIQGYRMLPFYLIAKHNKIRRFIVHAHTDVEEKDFNNPLNKLNRTINAHLRVEKVSCGFKASKNIFGEKVLINKQIMHIPNSIDPDIFLKPIDVKEKRNEVVGLGNENTRIIGNVARFHKQKNHLFMIKIIEELSQSHLDFLWLFIGEGALTDSFKQLVKEKKLENYVRFLGRRNDLSDLYQIMDVFVLPSLYEGLPTVAIEAQAAGTNTFLSDTITEESDLGLDLVRFLPLDSASDWASAITQLEQKQTINIHDREKKMIEKKFTNQQSAGLYLSFLNQKIINYDI